LPQSGVVTAIPGVATVRALPSFRRMELAVQPGMHQAITIDCFTRPGSALLMHADPAVLEQDVAAIRKLELGGERHTPPAAAASIKGGRDGHRGFE
jgi:hypothetical protein